METIDTIDTSNYGSLPECAIGIYRGVLDAKNRRQLFPFVLHESASGFAIAHGGTVARSSVTGWYIAIIPLKEQPCPS